MKITKVSIIKSLLRYWKRRLYLEAIFWLKNKYPIEYNINVAVLYDALKQAMHSSWREWSYGSRFFFWRWPSLLTRESRDGYRVLHIYFPLPKLRFYSPPIK